MIKIEIKGDNLTGWFGDAELVKMKPVVTAIGAMAGERFVRYAKAFLSHRGVGRTYRRVSGRKRRPTITQHQASAPGNPPALDKGKLRNSIKATKPRWRKGYTLVVRVGSRLPQARALEFGGRVGRKLLVRLSARPFLRPAEKMVNQQLDAAFNQMPDR